MNDEIKICTSCWEEECVCDYEQYVFLDKNIADAIINMNLKGYRTSYSCEGHIETDDGKTESRVLDIYFTTQQRFENLPEGFAYSKSKTRTDAHRTILYKYKNGTLYARINKKYIPYDLEEDKQRHLGILKKWVDELPALDKKTNPYCYSEYMRTGAPRRPDYTYEVKGWKTYRVEVDREEFETIQQYIFDYQGKIEEITDCGDVLVLHYLASHDMFLKDKSEYSWWLESRKQEAYNGKK